MSLAVTFTVATAFPATGEDTGFATSTEERLVDVGGQKFELSGVDADTAQQVSGSARQTVKAVYYAAQQTQLNNCRVVQAVERGKRAPVFFLGVCEGELAGTPGQTAFCLNPEGRDFHLGQPNPPLTKPSELALRFSDCLLETCVHQDCD